MGPVRVNRSLAGAVIFGWCCQGVRPRGRGWGQNLGQIVGQNVGQAGRHGLHKLLDLGRGLVRAMAGIVAGVCRWQRKMAEMDENLAQETPQAGTQAPVGKQSEQKEEHFLVFLVKLVLIVFFFRSFVFATFNIPSESMLPRLVNGDYLVAAKWPYGYSSYSLPYSLPLIPGRVLARQPERGDIAIFKAPPANNVDYIKRVIGLPGDTIQMKGGQLFINGVAVPKVKVADFEIAVSPNTSCYQPHYGAMVNYQFTRADGQLVCRYPQYRETLPGANGQPGKSYNVLDMETAPKDDTEPYLVPEGHLFMMGDDRDNSADSRFSPEENGIGFVPQANLVGQAKIMMWSTDGSASWFKPWTWFSAARWGRIGGGF